MYSFTVVLRSTTEIIARNVYSPGWIREFVSKTLELLGDCVEVYKDYTDAYDSFSLAFEKKEWISLQEPIANLMASITVLDEEDKPKLLEAVDVLTTYISTHHVHLVLGGFRKLNDPNETTFDILNCSLDEFEVHCNPSYMSVVANLAFLALVENQSVPLRGKRVLDMVLTSGMDLELLVEYFTIEKSKARIHFSNLHF